VVSNTQLYANKHSFGQEQVPIAAISALTAGSPGEAATLAGGSVSLLLAAANPCDKVRN
jgi:hypothetical protein